MAKFIDVSGRLTWFYLAELSNSLIPEAYFDNMMYLVS